jgi:hypothetical protein
VFHGRPVRLAAHDNSDESGHSWFLMLNSEEG